VRTTVSIDDALLAAAKRTARQRGVTLGRLVEDALRRALNEPVGADAPELPVFEGGTGPRPGVPLRSNRGLLEFLEGAGADTQA
jgi:hypothetical protein